jgi:glycosyltransferase involved in cell wall biosynthesis
VAELLSAADACIAILKPIEMYKTTYPNKVFDYMAARKPVILAIDGVIRDVVEKAGCGVFCRPGDPKALAAGIMTLYNNQEESIRMGKKGYDFLKENFSREKIAADLIDIMGEMVRKRG